MGFSLNDIGVAVGGLLGPNSSTYNAGAGAVVAGGLNKLEGSVKGWLYDQGAKLGSRLGNAGAVIPGIVAAGAAGTGAQASSAFEAKVFGYSINQYMVFGALAVGGLLFLAFRPRR